MTILNIINFVSKQCIPENIRNEALGYLTPYFKNVVKEFEEKYGYK